MNRLIADANTCFADHGWALPPMPRWDVTDFGLGDHHRFGLVLVNLSEQAEYCEKLMYAKQGMVTPKHRHGRKKEDIIARWGQLSVRVWPNSLPVLVNGEPRDLGDYAEIVLRAGDRITLIPGVDHEFDPLSDECIIGEVSSANDDLNDNFFENPRVGRFSNIEEDEPAIVRLVGDR